MINGYCIDNSSEYIRSKTDFQNDYEYADVEIRIDEITVAR